MFASLKEVAAWVEQQNEQTFGYLQAIPEREQIKSRLTELWNYEKFSSPFKRGGRYYFYKNDGLQNQYVLYVSETLNGEPNVLIDPNQWTKDGTKSLSGTYFSDDGKYVAYGVSEAGSDWKKFQILEIASGKILDEVLDWVKFSGAEWTKDGQGFFYNRYPEVKEGDEFQNLNLNQKVYYHRVGTPQSDDVMVYERPDHPEWGFGTDVSDDGQWLVLTVWKGTDDKYQVFYRDLTEPLAGFVQLIDQFENEYSFLGNDGPVFYFQTDVDAPRGRVIAIDTTKPEKPHWKEIIPQADETLRSISFVGNHFLASYLKDARSQVKFFPPRESSFAKSNLKESALPPASPGSETTTKLSIRFPVSILLPVSIVTTSQPVKANYSDKPRSILMAATMSSNRSFTKVKTAPRSRCSSRITKT